MTDWILTWAPDLRESIKWNMLCFSGRKLICGLSACQRHLGITFFRGTELADPAGLFTEAGANNTNIRSVRVTSLDALDRRALRALLQAAVDLDADPQIAPAPKRKREPWPLPKFFKEALARRSNRASAEGFARMSATCQREYLVWLSSAVQPETRERRLRETLAAVADGRKWALRHATGKPSGASSAKQGQRRQAIGAAGRR